VVEADSINPLFEDHDLTPSNPPSGQAFIAQGPKIPIMGNSSDPQDFLLRIELIGYV